MKTMQMHKDTGPKQASRKRPETLSPDALLSAAVEAALEEARSNEEAAVDILIGQLRADSALLNAFAECGQLKYAVRRLLGDYLSAERRSIINHADGKGVSGETLDGGRSQRIVEGGFLYFVLPIKGSPFIKDASVEQLRDAARKWTVMGRDYLAKGRFCELAAEAKDGGKKLTSEMLHGMWGQAHGAH